MLIHEYNGNCFYNEVRARSSGFPIFLNLTNTDTFNYVLLDLGPLD